jgi:hypothetical protein
MKIGAKNRLMAEVVGYFRRHGPPCAAADAVDRRYLFQALVAGAAALFR